MAGSPSSVNAMRRALRLLLAGMFALLVLVPAEPAAAAVSGGSGVVVLEQPANPTAPAGPNLTPQQQPPDKTKQKLVIGVLAAILLVIVFLGRNARNKRLKKAGSATSK
jgi:hypothetical protein